MKNIILSVIYTVLGLGFSGCSVADSSICSKISEIKVIPFKGERVNDEVYNKLITQSKESVPCLIDQITNNQLMPDPRQMPPYNGVTIGDVALFVLMDIKGIAIEKLLSDELRQEFSKNGMYTYFEYVADSENRLLIQEEVKRAVLK